MSETAIHKQQLVAWSDDIQKIPGKVIHVDNQFGSLTAWYEADEATSTTVLVLSTGAAIPDDAKHLGSAVVNPLVWHVYEVRS